jgi:hypothetical protein
MTKIQIDPTLMFVAIPKPASLLERTKGECSGRMELSAAESAEIAAAIQSRLTEKTSCCELVQTCHTLPNGDEICFTHCVWAPC